MGAEFHDHRLPVKTHIEKFHWNFWDKNFPAYSKLGRSIRLSKWDGGKNGFFAESRLEFPDLVLQFRQGAFQFVTLQREKAAKI